MREKASGDLTTRGDTTCVTKCRLSVPFFSIDVMAKRVTLIQQFVTHVLPPTIGVVVAL